MVSENQILKELKVIRMELDFIKDNMPDKDMFLTAEEEKLLEESFANEKSGKLTSSKNIRKELRL
jgi:hypothetical protein